MKPAEEELITKTVKAFEKKFGEGRATTLTKAFAPEKARGFVPTGNLAIDWCIGRPGIPLGRISEIAGSFGSGKSSVVAKIIGSAQKAGVVCILFDTEHSYSSDWSTRFGVDPERLILVEPDHLQGLFDELRFVIGMIKEEQPQIPIFVAIDSVSAVPSAEELDQEDSTAGKQRAQHAKIISEGLRKVSNLLWDQNVAVLFVSQLKTDPTSMYGGPSKLGGSAIDFHAGLQLTLKRTSFKNASNTDSKKRIGQTMQVQCVKNKFVSPYRARTFDLYYDTGFNEQEIMLDFMVELEEVKKSGGWYDWKGSKYRMEQLAKELSLDNLPRIYNEVGLTPPLGIDKIIQAVQEEVKSPPVEIEEAIEPVKQVKEEENQVSNYIRVTDI